MGAAMTAPQSDEGHAVALKERFFYASSGKPILSLASVCRTTCVFINRTPFILELKW